MKGMTYITITMEKDNWDIKQKYPGESLKSRKWMK